MLLAQDFTIAATVPDHARYFIHDPGLARLPSGRLLCAAPCWIRGGHESHMILSRSDDGGLTWERLPDLPYAEATPFCVGDALYLFTQERQHHNVCFIRSTDEGETWTEPSCVIEGPYWNCQTSMVERDGRLYWGIDALHREIAAVAADLSADLLSPSAWRVSGFLPLPDVPDSFTRRLNPPNSGQWARAWSHDIWLEPNVVDVNGHLRMLIRVVVDEYSTTGFGAVCDLADDGTDLQLTFTQFHPIPGGQGKFAVVHDPESRLFWMVSNVASDAQDYWANRERLREAGFHGGPGNERRFLMLWYSIDALNWFPVGCVAMWPSPVQSFMYPSMVIDGDDLAVLSRTSRDSGNQHDADLATFHRIRDFRSLALDLRPRF